MLARPLAVAETVAEDRGLFLDILAWLGRSFVRKEGRKEGRKKGRNSQELKNHLDSATVLPRPALTCRIYLQHFSTNNQ